MPVGLTNYAAGFDIKITVIDYFKAYATGLLLARRVLTKLNLADKYQGNSKIDGEDYMVDAIDGEPKPFFALLDVGLRRTTTGSRVFGVLKVFRLLNLGINE